MLKNLDKPKVVGYAMSFAIGFIVCGLAASFLPEASMLIGFLYGYLGFRNLAKFIESKIRK